MIISGMRISANDPYVVFCARCGGVIGRDCAGHTKEVPLDAEIQAILDMSDEEILADARARGIDPEQNAIEMCAIFERAKLIADKKK